MNEWIPKIKKAALGVLVIALLWRVFIGSGSTLLVLAAITLMASHAFDWWSARRTIANKTRQEWQEDIRLNELNLQNIHGVQGWENQDVYWIQAKTAEFQLCWAKFNLPKFDKYTARYAHRDPLHDIELPKISGKTLDAWLIDGHKLINSHYEDLQKLEQELAADNHRAVDKFIETDNYEAQFAVIRQNIEALFAPTIQKINANR